MVVQIPSYQEEREITLMHVVSLVLQTGYKQVFQLIKVCILTLIVPLFQVPQNRWKN